MANAGHRRGVAFGALGLAVAWLVTSTLGAGGLVWEFRLGVATGATATLVAAWWLGGRAYDKLVAASLGRAAGIGICVGVASMELGVVFGSVPQLFMHADVRRWGLGTEVYAYIVKPLYWFTLFGLLPSVMLGASFGVKVASDAAPGSAEPEMAQRM